MMVQLGIFLRISFLLSRDCDEPVVPRMPVLAPVSAPAPAPLARTLGLPCGLISGSQSYHREVQELEK